MIGAYSAKYMQPYIHCDRRIQLLFTYLHVINGHKKHTNPNVSFVFIEVVEVKFQNKTIALDFCFSLPFITCTYKIPIERSRMNTCNIIWLLTYCPLRHWRVGQQRGFSIPVSLSPFSGGYSNFILVASLQYPLSSARWLPLFRFLSGFHPEGLSWWCCPAPFWGHAKFISGSFCNDYGYILLLASVEKVIIWLHRK